jgi:methylated-DNA-[protein]-cysteine S-methyltransferase
MSDTVVFRIVSSPIGNMYISGSALGLRAIRKTEDPVTSQNLPQEHAVEIAAAQLAEYFDKKRTVFHLDFDFSGHPKFSVEVWHQLLNIPYGTTAAYSDIAEKMNAPKAVRAVGMANRNNPFAIVVPCHRVIGKSGDLTGYFYGLDTKMQLLRLENPARYPVQMQFGF